MPESSNIEIAHKLAQHEDAESAKKSWQDLVIEIVEAALLGVVAVATAWSAYQAAKWDGHEAELYGRSARHGPIPGRAFTALQVPPGAACPARHDVGPRGLRAREYLGFPRL